MATDVIARSLAAGAGRSIAQSAVPSSHTGDTTLTTVATATVPAGALGANGTLKGKAVVSFTGTGTKTVTISFGSATIYTSTSIGNTVTAIKVDFVLGNRGSAASQFIEADTVNSSNTATLQPGTGAVDTTAVQSLTVAVRSTVGTDAVTLEYLDTNIYPKG